MLRERLMFENFIQLTTDLPIQKRVWFISKGFKRPWKSNQFPKFLKFIMSYLKYFECFIYKYEYLYSFLWIFVFKLC